MNKHLLHMACLAVLLTTKVFAAEEPKAPAAPAATTAAAQAEIDWWAERVGPAEITYWIAIGPARFAKASRIARA